jgi:hypothetical protein
MKGNDSQVILNQIMDNPEILSVIPPDVFILKFLSLTGHKDVRKFLLANENILSMPVGYISNILKSADMKVLHLLKINKNYYINNDCYDYYIKDNKISGSIRDDFSKLSNDDKFKKNLDIIIYNPDIIIVQDESACELDTSMIKYLLTKRDMGLLLNLKTYDKSEINRINGNKYKINVLVNSQKEVYFNSNNKQYIYKDEEVIKTSWNKSDIRPILTIYTRDEDIASKIGAVPVYDGFDYELS